LIAMTSLRAFVTALLLLTLAACATTAPVAPKPGVVLPPPVQPVKPPPTPPPPETKPPLSPNLPKGIETSGAAAPVISLVKAARASLAAGRTDQAGASLERALRIEPRNAWVWQGLSQLHIVTQQAEQAESEAKKSISLGKRNPYLDVENWRLLAEARTLRGDVAGAAQAQARHEELQRLIEP